MKKKASTSVKNTQAFMGSKGIMLLVVLLIFMIIFCLATNHIIAASGLVILLTLVVLIVGGYLKGKFAFSYNGLSGEISKPK